MQEEIKEILDSIKRQNEWEGIEYFKTPLSTKQANKLLDYITNLQEENEYSNHCNEELRKKITNLEYKIERLEEDNKQLKELCDKYEEEHNNAFKLWTMKMEEMPDYEERMNYKLRNEKAIEFMKENCDIIILNNGWIIRSELTTTGLGKLFKILQGSDDNGSIS